MQLQGLRGALRQLQQETEQNCRRELQQVHGQLAGEAWGRGLMGWPPVLGFPSQQPAPTRTSGTHGQPASGLWRPPRPGQHLYPELSGFTERGPGPGQDHRSLLVCASWTARSLFFPSQPQVVACSNGGCRLQNQGSSYDPGCDLTSGSHYCSVQTGVTVSPSQAWLKSPEEVDDVLAHDPPGSCAPSATH